MARRTAGGGRGLAYAGVGATGGIRMMTSRESRLAQPPARTRIVAWNTCGRVVSRTISFLASTMKRTRLPGVTFLKPWSVMIKVHKDVVLADAYALDRDLADRSRSAVWWQVVVGLIVACAGTGCAP